MLFGLTIAILLGTFVGTYSSIYTPAPALVWMGLKPDSFLRAADDKDAKPPFIPPKAVFGETAFRFGEWPLGLR